MKEKHQKTGSEFILKGFSKQAKRMVYLEKWKQKADCRKGWKTRSWRQLT
jgi:hypothetical protein